MNRAMMKTKGHWDEGVLERIAGEYGSLGPDEILQEFRRLHGLTVENLCRMAVLVRLAEERGIDLSELPGGTLINMLRKIAAGQVLPELVHRFAINRTLYRRAEALPLPDQRRVAADELFTVVELGEDGPTHRLLPPSKLAPEQVSQVFASDHIRDEAEQITWLQRRAQREPRQAPGPIVYDKDKVRITQPVTLSRRELLDMLARLERG